MRTNDIVFHQKQQLKKKSLIAGSWVLSSLHRFIHKRLLPAQLILISWSKYYIEAMILNIFPFLCFPILVLLGKYQLKKKSLIAGSNDGGSLL
jgi:hypothetical protein